MRIIVEDRDLGKAQRLVDALITVDENIDFCPPGTQVVAVRSQVCDNGVQEDSTHGHHETYRGRDEDQEDRTRSTTGLLRYLQGRTFGRGEARVCSRCGATQGATEEEVKYDYCGGCGRSYLSTPDECETHNTTREGICTRCGQTQKEYDFRLMIGCLVKVPMPDISTEMIQPSRKASTNETSSLQAAGWKRPLDHAAA